VWVHPDQLDAGAASRLLNDLAPALVRGDQVVSSGTRRQLVDGRAQHEHGLLVALLVEQQRRVQPLLGRLPSGRQLRQGIHGRHRRDQRRSHGPGL
jgi:ribose 1,5-bisphosphokinase PhnN